MESLAKLSNMEILVTILWVVILSLLACVFLLKRKNDFQQEILEMQTDVLKVIHQKLGEARSAMQAEMLAKEKQAFEKPKRPRGRPRKNV